MPQPIDRITFEGNLMIVRSNGRKYRVRTDQISARLAAADQSVKESVRFSPEGYVISWPKLQLELPVAGLFQMCQATF